jgi:hypothetical protein
MQKYGKHLEVPRLQQSKPPVDLEESDEIEFRDE